MFGLFRNKIDAGTVGEIIAENSITYTEPVLIGLKKFGRLDDRLSERHLLEYGYSLMLNSGSVLVPLLLHYLRNVSFDRNGFKQGAKSYFDRFRDVYCEKLDLSFTYDFWSSVEASESEIRNNPNFQRTNAFYGNGAQDSVYANLVRFLAETSTPSVYPQFTQIPSFDDEDWGYILECIEGLDRSFKWLTQCFDYKRMKRL